MRSPSIRGSYSKGASPEEFIKRYMSVYERDGTRKDLSAELEMPYETVLSRIKAYRRQGLKLPPLRKGQVSATATLIPGLQKIVDDRIRRINSAK